MASKTAGRAPASIALNKKARFNYTVEERFEAGLALEGWEVKSLRAGKAQLSESYVTLRGGEAWLFGSHIAPMASASSHVQPDPARTRKLLMHRKELDRLTGAGGAARLHAGTAGAVLERWPGQARRRARQRQAAARQTGRGERPGLAARPGPGAEVSRPHLAPAGPHPLKTPAAPLHCDAWGRPVSTWVAKPSVHAEGQTNSQNQLQTL